jgi:hypothetical protein
MEKLEITRNAQTEAPARVWSAKLGRIWLCTVVDRSMR